MTIVRIKQGHVSSSDVRHRSSDMMLKTLETSVKPRTFYIVCLKLDHVGDLLIAAPALLMLRKSFPTAHITLLCGPWNARLADRLAVADVVRPISYFSQNSSDDLPSDIARREKAVRAIKELNLPPCDVAIDLRRDEDTRGLLKLIDARHYAGFGDLATFSYLDVVLPFTKHLPAAGATGLRLRPHDLLNGQAHAIDATGLHLTAARGHVDLQMSTDAVWAPAEDSGDDYRPLGIAFSRVDVAVGNRSTAEKQPAQVIEVARADMSFGSGWLEWEPWGRWTSTTTAGFRVHLSLIDPDIRVFARVQGHTSSSHPQVTATISAGEASVDHVFRAGDEPVTLALDLRATMSAPVARSLPYLMRGGRYRGAVRVGIESEQDWEPLAVTIRTAQSNSVIARLILPDEAPGEGPLRFPFEVELKDAADPVMFEIEPVSTPHRGQVGILGLDLDWQQGKYPQLPLVHMEQQLLDLTAMVAQRYAQRLVSAEAAEVADRLSRSARGSTAAAAARRLRRIKRSPKWWVGLDGPKLIGIGVGANKATKLWPAVYFVDLCRRLLADPALYIVFIGGPAEQARVREIASELSAGERAIDLTACCAIADLGEVLAQLDGFIGLDTGTTHFAGRVGVPTLAIFGASHDPGEWGPVGERSDWTAADVPCAGCSFSETTQCDFALRCMTAMTPDDIWPAAERLARTAGRG